jgi:hypothetical protein
MRKRELLKVHARCPLWVKSGRDALKFRCPLYPRKRTLPDDSWMSAKGQKRKSSSLINQLICTSH